MLRFIVAIVTALGVCAALAGPGSASQDLLWQTVEGIPAVPGDAAGAGLIAGGDPVD